MDFSFYTNKHIVITGGTGYIGQAIVRMLSQVACKIIIVSRSKKLPDSFIGLPTNISLLTTDITNYSIWQDALEDTDFLFHLSGQTSSAYSNTHPLEDYEINVVPII